MKKIYDSVIIGSGPAGLTAGIYNIRADLKTIVLAGNQPGGQLTITTTVDNFPGFPNGIGGVKLMMDMQQQYKNLGGEIKQGVVKKIKPISDLSLDKKCFELQLDDNSTLFAKTVIIATGAGAKWLEIPKEKDLIGRGVSGCATCDGMFFREKTVAVIGGGDTACEDADFLAKFAKKVYLIHRRDSLRAQTLQQKLVLNNSKIEILWNNEVMEINHNPSPVTRELPLTGESKDKKLENIKIKNNKTGEEKVLEIEGLFVAIGRTPTTDFVKDLVEVKETGYIIVHKNPRLTTMTSIPGIFAAGDCADDTYRQAIVASGEGGKAGLDVERWLKETKD